MLTRKKNILFLLFTPRFSGAEKVIASLIENNPQVFSYVLCAPGYFSNGLMNCKNIFYSSAIRKLNRDSLTFLARVFLVSSILLRLNYEVVRIIIIKRINHVHINNITLSFYLLPSALFFLLAGDQIKFTWHDQNLSYYNEKYEKLFYKICRKIYSGTIVVSEAVGKKYAGKKKVHLIYSGIDTQKFSFSESDRFQIRNEFNIGNKLVVGYFGVFTNYKGVDFLIENLIKLKENYPSLFLLLIGRFDENSYDKTKIMSLLDKIIKENYTIKDWCDDIQRYYSSVDVFVNTTTAKRAEPLGTTILEAMSCKCPVLASSTGGTQEIIEDEVNGFLFEADCGASFINKMNYIIKNYNNLETVRRKARSTVIEKFSITKMVNEYNNFINSFYENS